MLLILAIVFVVLLLIAEAYIFLIVGIILGMKGIVKRLLETGWTIEPPKEGAE